MEFRSSLSWFNPQLSLKKFRAIPFVGKSGKFSIHTLCVWKSYPEQVIFSLISTVHRRVLKILMKRHVTVSKRLLNACFKMSILYCITRNNWIIDRFLGMTRAKRGAPIKKVESLIHVCVCALDANKRFVYSQAYFQANWLKFQVFRPSDKSGEKVQVGTHLRNLGFYDVSSLHDNRLLSESFQRSSDLWQIHDIVSGDTGAHFLGSSESASLLSEPIEFNGSLEEDQSSDEDW